MTKVTIDKEVVYELYWTLFLNTKEWIGKYSKIELFFQFIMTKVKIE